MILAHDPSTEAVNDVKQLLCHHIHNLPAVHIVSCCALEVFCAPQISLTS